MIKELLISMVVSVANVGGIDTVPTVSVQDLPGHQLAVHAHSKKSDKQWIIFDQKLIGKISDEEKLELVVHEMAHMMVHLEHGKRKAKANKGHKSVYKTTCWDLAEAVGVNKLTACSPEL